MTKKSLYIYVCMYVCIYIYIYIDKIEKEEKAASLHSVPEKSENPGNCFKFEIENRKQCLSCNR